MTQVFGVSEGRVSTSIILSFLVFSLANFPANHIIDTQGLRVSFLAGTALYTAGMVLYLLIDHSYSFVIAGTVLMGLGQPFLMNSPAKVAAFWFFPKNVSRKLFSEHWPRLSWWASIFWELEWGF
jgi:MFS transporter, FLVCR family, feline leukemia virus subgroup C receptor-related protein